TWATRAARKAWKCHAEGRLRRLCRCPERVRLPEKTEHLRRALRQVRTDLREADVFSPAANSRSTQRLRRWSRRPVHGRRESFCAVRSQHRPPALTPGAANKPRDTRDFFR